MAIPPLRRIALPAALPALAGAPPARGRSQLDALKQEVPHEVDAHGGPVPRIVDQLFSYGERGFPEFETSGYLVDLLREPLGIRYPVPPDSAGDCAVSRPR